MSNLVTNPLYESLHFDIDKPRVKPALLNAS